MCFICVTATCLSEIFVIRFDLNKFLKFIKMFYFYIFSSKSSGWTRPSSSTLRIRQSLSWTTARPAARGPPSSGFATRRKEWSQNLLKPSPSRLRWRRHRVTTFIINVLRRQWRQRHHAECLREWAWQLQFVFRHLQHRQRRLQVCRRWRHLRRVVKRWRVFERHLNRQTVAHRSLSKRRQELNRRRLSSVPETNQFMPI